MATIYKRLELYCKTNQVEMPELEIRKEIGAIVIAAWFSEENILHKHIPLHKKTFIDESGTTVKVLSYPKKFIPIIDKIILKHYFEKNNINNNLLKNYYQSESTIIRSPIEKKQRKRIPVAKKPVYTSKKH
jgi:hypothetical protein